MKHLIYVHGFLSSPQSFKAQALGNWLKSNHPQVHYHCPALPAYPELSRVALDQLVEQCLLGSPTVEVGLIGSSLGGFWATYLAERYDLKAVLINPAVKPHLLLPPFLGQNLRNYHLEETYLLTEKDLETLKSLDAPIRRHNNYLLLLQKGDETLDYRLAVEQYTGCQQILEEGGDHAFQGFERFFEPIYNFYNE